MQSNLENTISYVIGLQFDTWLNAKTTHIILSDFFFIAVTFNRNNLLYIIIILILFSYYFNICL